MSVSKKTTGISQEAFIKIYTKNQGKVKKSCEESGVGLSTFYDWKKDPEFVKKLDHVDEVTVDMMVDCLLESGEALKESAIFFYLRKKGKKKGYGEATPNDFVHIPEWRDAKTPVEKLQVIDLLLAEMRISPSQAQAMGAHVNVSYNIESRLDDLTNKVEALTKAVMKGAMDAC